MKRLFLCVCILLSAAHHATAADTLTIHFPVDSLQKEVRTSNFPKLKQLVYPEIKGAPILAQPMRIDGTKYEIRTEEHGLAYPTVYDWNHDGKPDLLMGEFLTGQSRIKVYLNKGTKNKPVFTGEWFYATDKNGKVMSNYQWCCIGIHPQIVDINGDGIPDIVSGQYYPGVITWWKGTNDGFEEGKEIPQLGYQKGKRYSGVGGDEPDWSMEAHNYWNYSSARMADFNGDGLPDLFVAGCGGYRVALNIGTKEEPKFGRREFLYQTDGTILHTFRNPKERVAPGCFFNAVQVCSGTAHCYLNPVDWDGDGVLDLFITDEYVTSSEKGVYFARGIKTDKGLRFEEPIPFFTTKDSGKALPGCTPHVQIADYNGDGVPDLIMGLSVPTINGFEGASGLYEKYIRDLNLPSPGKDTGEQMQYYSSYADLQKRFESDPYMKDFFIGKTGELKYMTLRHRGYPFVFLGKKNKLKVKAEIIQAKPAEFNYDARPQMTEEQSKYVSKEPVRYFIKLYNKGEKHVDITLSTSGSYHLYTSAPINKNQIPLTIDFDLPEGITKKGELKTPPVIAAGANEIYDGKVLEFEQALSCSPDLKPGEYKIKVRINYQTCSSDMCLPPVEIEKEETVTIE